MLSINFVVLTHNVDDILLNFAAIFKRCDTSMEMCGTFVPNLQAFPETCQVSKKKVGSMVKIKVCQ